MSSDPDTTTDDSTDSKEDEEEKRTDRQSLLTKAQNVSVPASIGTPHLAGIGVVMAAVLLIIGFVTNTLLPVAGVLIITTLLVVVGALLIRRQQMDSDDSGPTIGEDGIAIEDIDSASADERDSDADPLDPHSAVDEADDDDTDVSFWAQQAERLKAWEDRQDWKSHWRRVKSPVAHVVALAVTAAVIYLVLQWMWTALGPIETIAGVVVFVITAVSIPVGIMLFGPSFIGIFKSIFGKAHWFTAHLAWQHAYLVETNTGYELCPGNDEEYYLDGRWHDIDHGIQNKTVVLGLPFGIIRHKDKETYQDLCYDPVSKTTQTDGGVASANGQSGNGTAGDSSSKPDGRRRARMEEVSPSLSSTGHRIDLVKVASGGLLQAGDAELIERAEYDELEDIAGGSRLDGFLPILAMLFGIIFGSVMGLFMTGAI